MKIAVLGSGNIGGTLGGKWARAGHEVVYGVRNPSAPSHPQAGVRFDTASNAAGYGEVIVLAVPASGVQSALQEAAGGLDGKVVIDATNNLGSGEANVLGTIATVAPTAKPFRAFNALGWENFADPVFDGVEADLFYCGPDDPGATAAVEQLIGEVGLRPIRVGGLDKVGVIDNLLLLWFALAVEQGLGRRVAFKMLGPA